MMRFEATERGRGQDATNIPELFRTATDSFVELVAAHIRLANLELVADIETRTRLVVTQLVVSVVGVFGYGLLMVGLGLAAGEFMNRWVAFLILGGLHLAAAGIAALILSRRQRQKLQIEKAIHSMGRSVTVVADAILGSNHARS